MCKEDKVIGKLYVKYSSFNELLFPIYYTYSLLKIFAYIFNIETEI